MQDHLYEQIIFAFRDDTERAIAMNLSEQIDDAGYFIGDLVETAGKCNNNYERIQAVFSVCKLLSQQVFLRAAYRNALP